MEQKTSNFSIDHVYKTSVNPEFYVYNRTYHRLSYDEAFELGTVKLYIALCMLAHNKLAKDLVLDMEDIFHVKGRLYDLLDGTGFNSEDWKNMNCIMDVVSDRFVTCNGFIDFPAISEVYSMFGLSRTEGFIHEISKLAGTTKPEILIAAICIMFSCPGVYMPMSKGNFRQASEYVESCKKILERQIRNAK